MDIETRATVFLGLGSDMGERRNNLKTALAVIDEKAGSISASSSVYETEPWGFRTDSVFLNMAVRIETGLDPSDLLTALLAIEKSMGRIRGKEGYSSRIIDIDILFYNDLVIESHNLVIPHPLLHSRRFVLAPLAEIAPDYVHPVFKKSILSLLASCTDTSKVVRL